MSPPHNHGFKVRHGKGARLAAFSVFALAPFLPAPQRVSFCFLQGWGWGGGGLVWEKQRKVRVRKSLSCLSQTIIRQWCPLGVGAYYSDLH